MYLIIIKLFILFIIISANNYAQWSSNPNTNLQVCDLNGEQVLPKTANTPNGGTYISWFDNRTGNYQVYLQLLDFNGNKQFTENGLLISGNPQSTSLVDYNMICDSEGNSILIFSDTRNNGNLNVFAYKISPTGEFLWGANGVSLSTSGNFQPNGTAAQTDDGGYVFAWIEASSPNKVLIQKLSSNGNKLWGENPISLQGSASGFTNPFLVKSDSNSVLLLHTSVTGNFPAQTVKLRANKIKPEGTRAWGIDGVSIQDLGTIAAFSVPKVYSDGNNGAFMAWHDDRDNNALQSAFVQRISSSGNLYFPVNGAEGSISPARQKYNPVVSFNINSNETYLFWRETEPNQSQNGIYGQKFSENGTRLWDNNGKEFHPLTLPNTTSISNLTAIFIEGKAVLFYTETNATMTNSVLEGFAVDGNGNYIWNNNIILVSSGTNGKNRVVSSKDIFGNIKLAWADNRGNGDGIYAQNINPVGVLGNSFVPVELTSFSANVSARNVILNWSTASETNNQGFEVQKSEVGIQNSEYKVVGFVDGKGTTTELNNYSFTDASTSLSSSSVKYRLKQIDFDGKFEYSNVIEVEIGLPTEFSLSQNYPNPFNPSTVVSYQLPVDSKVSLRVFDILGNEVVTLINEIKNTGSYNVNFNAVNLKSGVYFYTIRAVPSTNLGQVFTETKKMLLIK